MHNGNWYNLADIVKEVYPDGQPGAVRMSGDRIEVLTRGEWTPMREGDRTFQHCLMTFDVSPDENGHYVLEGLTYDQYATCWSMCLVYDDGAVTRISHPFGLLRWSGNKARFRLPRGFRQSGLTKVEVTYVKETTMRRSRTYATCGKDADALTEAIRACTGTDYGSNDLYKLRLFRVKRNRMQANSSNRAPAFEDDGTNETLTPARPDDETLRLRAADAEAEARRLRYLLDKQRADADRLRRLAGVTEKRRRSTDELGRAVDDEEDPVD